VGVLPIAPGILPVKTASNEDGLIGRAMTPLALLPKGVAGPRCVCPLRIKTGLQMSSGLMRWKASGKPRHLSTIVRRDVSRAMIMRIKMGYDWDKKPRRLKNIRQIAMAMKIALPSTLLTAIETYALVA
jgi:hypothetical protein